VTARARTTLLLLLALVAACGPDARHKQLHATMVAVSAAGEGFVQFDKAAQAAIVASATSELDGIAKLGAYKMARARVVEAFSAAFQAIAAAALLDTKPASLANALAAAALARQAWDDLKKVMP